MFGNSISLSRIWSENKKKRTPRTNQKPWQHLNEREHKQILRQRNVFGALFTVMGVFVHFAVILSILSVAQMLGSFLSSVGCSVQQTRLDFCNFLFLLTLTVIKRQWNFPRLHLLIIPDSHSSKQIWIIPCWNEHLPLCYRALIFCISDLLGNECIWKSP